MKRDLDLIKGILEIVEQAEKPWAEVVSSEVTLNRDDIQVIDATDDALFHHTNIMAEAGLITFERYLGGNMSISLTWSGHEFLANLRHPGVEQELNRRSSGWKDWALEVIQKSAVDIAVKLVTSASGGD